VFVGVLVGVGGTGVFVGVLVGVGGAGVFVGVLVGVDGAGVFVGVLVGVRVAVGSKAVPVAVGGTGVFVGVFVGVLVGELVGVLVGVFVGVFVGVLVAVGGTGVFVGVLVGVFVGVFVAVGGTGVLVGVGVTAGRSPTTKEYDAVPVVTGVPSKSVPVTRKPSVYEPNCVKAQLKWACVFNGSGPVSMASGKTSVELKTWVGLPKASVVKRKNFAPEGPETESSQNVRQGFWGGFTEQAVPFACQLPPTVSVLRPGQRRLGF
jgi:hypothetical protein